MNTRLYRPGRAERSRRGRVAGPLRAGARAEPLFEPDLVLPAAGRLGGGGEALLTVEDGPDWTACLPVQAVRWHGWRVPVLMSWRHSYCFLGTPLLDPEAPVAALGCVLDQALPRARAGMFGPRCRRLGWRLRRCPRDGDDRARTGHGDISLSRARNARAPRGGRLPRGDARSSSPRAPPPATGLERLVGAVPTTREVSSDPVASERFLALERAGWKGRAGTAFASSPRHAEFFRTVCERFADAGRLELLAFRGRGPHACREVQPARRRSGVLLQERSGVFHDAGRAWREPGAPARGGQLGHAPRQLRSPEPSLPRRSPSRPPSPAGARAR